MVPHRRHGLPRRGGWIHFHGRGDDLIKTSGYRVGPAEVEASVMEVPGVAAM